MDPIRLVALSVLAFSTTTSVDAQATHIRHDWDSCYAYTASEDVADPRGDSIDRFFSDGVGFQAAYASGSYDIVDVESNCNILPAEVVTAVQDAVADGVPVRFAYWDMDGNVDPTGAAAISSAFGVTAAGDFSVPVDINDDDGYGFGASFGGTILPDGTDDDFDNGDAFTGGTSCATSSTGSVCQETSAGLINGFTFDDHEGSDANDDGTPDVGEFLSAQWDHLLGGGPSGPNLTFTGACLGMITNDITGLTAGSQVAAARSSTLGSFTIPSGGCAGTGLGLASPSLVGLFPTGSGSQSFMPSIGAGSCGDDVEVVDIATCATSNIEQL